MFYCIVSYCFVLNVHVLVSLFAASADKSGAIVGVFISILILAAGISVGYFLYTHRDKICLSTYVLQVFFHTFVLHDGENE